MLVVAGGLLLLASAAAGGAVLNARSPLLLWTQVQQDNVSATLILRQGDSAEELADAACAHFGRCTAGDRGTIASQLARHIVEAARGSAGERLLRQLHFGWDLLLHHNHAAEARLQFAHTLAQAPSSSFLARELAAAALAAARPSATLVAWGSDGAWAYRQPHRAEDHTADLELWETYASVRFQPPAGRLEEEEAELLALGMPASGFVPNGELNPHDGTSTQLALTHAHRLRHDLQLVQLLQAKGLLPKAQAEAATAAYREVLAQAPRPKDSEVLEPTEAQWRLLQPFHNRRLYVHPSPGLPVDAIVHSAPATVVHSGTASPSPAGGLLTGGGVLVVDGLLSAPALAALRDFAELSTIWFQERPAYLGAVMCTGFATPLLGQIAQELRRALPELLCDLPLANVWAYKYDDELQSGIDVHADDAAVNVNLWITPDEDNLDPSTGGLVVFDATSEMMQGSPSFTEFNGHSAAKEELLRSTERRNVTVPYKQNRAVIFDSARFHGTQTFKFRPGLRSRRINVTFLFGPKGAYCPRKREAELRFK